MCVRVDIWIFDLSQTPQMACLSGKKSARAFIEKKVC